MNLIELTESQTQGLSILSYTQAMHNPESFLHLQKKVKKGDVNKVESRLTVSSKQVLVHTQQ